MFLRLSVHGLKRAGRIVTRTKCQGTRHQGTVKSECQFIFESHGMRTKECCSSLVTLIKEISNGSATACSQSKSECVILGSGREADLKVWLLIGEPSAEMCYPRLGHITVDIKIHMYIRAHVLTCMVCTVHANIFTYTINFLLLAYLHGSEVDRITD